MTADSTLGTTAGDLHHYAITFTDTTGGGTVKWYRDGALVNTLSVGFHSAALHDVNNWLGRSLYSGDAMANVDYYDVRVQGTAILDGQVAGNYRIGPNDAKSTLYASDAYNNSGFANGSWEFGGGTPQSTRDYETGTLLLRTPNNASNVTFPGRSLSVTGGNFNLDASGARTVTVNDLRLTRATVLAYTTNGAAATLAGNLTVQNYTDNQIRGGTGSLVVSANITGGVGGGSLLYTENPVTLTGNNVGYLGATTVGDGRFSTLVISNETNLGGNPTYHGQWLQLNRGILQTTQTMTIDDGNRGIVIGPSGGFLRPNGGTTLTIATTVNSPAAGNSLQTTPLDSNPTLGILFVDGQGVVELTNPNNSHNAEMQILQGELRLSGNGRLNNGSHSWPVTLNARFTDNSALEQTFNGQIVGSGSIAKGGTDPLYLWNARNANTYSGGTTISAGLVGAGNSTALGTGTITLAGGSLQNPGFNPNRAVYTLTNPVVVTAASTVRGVLGDLVIGGNLTGNAALDIAGSYNASGLRFAGTNSGYTGVVTVSGPNVRLDAASAASAGAGWLVNGGLQLNAAGANAFDFGSLGGSGNIGGHVAQASSQTQMLSVGALNTSTTFSGTLTNNVVDSTATGNGDGAANNVLALTKVGNGTLTLTSTNTYTGSTAINAGALNVVGSLAQTGGVTVASGAALSGAGTLGGGLTLVGSAVHTPGSPVGVQSVTGPATYSAASKLNFTLTTNGNAAGAAGSVAATGALTVNAGAAVNLLFNGTGSTVAFNNVFWTQARTWPVATGSSLTGNFALGTVSADSGGRAASAYGTFALVQGSTGATLQWTPRPLFAFQGANFPTSLGNDAVSGYLADPDGDGVANILEALCGTNPNVGAANPLQAQTANGHLGLSFPRNSALTDVLVKVQGADAVTGPWTDLAQSVGGAAFAPVASGAMVGESGTGAVKTVSFADPYLTTDPAHPRRFLRVLIQPQ